MHVTIAKKINFIMVFKHYPRALFLHIPDKFTVAQQSFTRRTYQGPEALFYFTDNWSRILTFDGADTYQQRLHFSW
jgi:hypothetical protein